MYFRMIGLLIITLIPAFRTVISQEHVCLKAYDLGDMIKLNCTVDVLSFIVTFEDPLGRVYGRCEAAPHLEQCDLPNLSQDKATHTTVLLLKKTNDIYGTWTCNHGTNFGSDTVTISDPDICTQKVLQDNTCSSHWKGAAIGFIVILVISIPVNVVVAIYLLVKWIQGTYTTGEDQEESQPLIDNMDKTEDDSAFRCKACTMASVCGICSDCNTMYCEICCITHARSQPTHKVCQIDHDVTSNSNVICKSCSENKTTDSVCMTCILQLCSACCVHHRQDQTDHVIKRLVLTNQREHERRREVSAASLPKFEYKYQMKIKSKPKSQCPRICGVCFITDGRIAICEINCKQLHIYKKVFPATTLTHDLNQEPKGMASVTDNKIAITYPHEKQIKIYKMNEPSVEEGSTFEMPDKPFSIAFNYPNFAVELGESDDGVIAILDMEGEILRKIGNEKSFAYFTTNTIRLALDSKNEHVFVAAVSKKSVSCVNYSGEMVWEKRVPSPRSLVFVGNIESKRNILMASKRWNLIFNINSADGQNDIIKSSGRVKGPRFIDYNFDEKLLCIHVDDGIVLIYEYDITDVGYLNEGSDA